MSVRLLVFLVVLAGGVACAGAAPQTPTSTSVPWPVYELASSLRCDYNFKVEVPPTWVVDKTSTCESVGFQYRDGRAMVQVGTYPLPHYSSDPDEALQELNEDWQGDFPTFSAQGSMATVNVLSTISTQHHGNGAIRLTG